MIVIKLEMWPRGDESKKYPLGQAYVWNDGTVSDRSRGNYGVAVCRKVSTDRLKPLRRGEVSNYPRLSYNIWRLILRALMSAFPEER